jgi:hypothetical protein
MPEMVSLIPAPKQKKISAGFYLGEGVSREEKAEMQQN